jgi:hypothetical protein
MEITMRWHRLLRALAFVAGGLVFSVLIIFIFSNLAPINVHWRIPATVGYSYDLTLPEVNTWLIALVPLLLGLVAGYLYQTPARMHHVREALRHRHRVHELEHELKEMRTSLDRLLMMPEDGRPAIPAQIMAPVERREAESEDERDPRLPDEPAAVEVLAAKPVKEEVKAAVRKAPAAVKAARPRRRFFGGLQAEVAEIKLPASIPATIVARPRRNGRAAAEGKAVPAKAEPEATAPARPARKRTSKKSS